MNTTINIKLPGVLFVCLGNICRSPTAHGVFAKLLQTHGCTDKVRVDSAGTGDWHIGHAPDNRAVLAAKDRDYDISALRARGVMTADFYEFNYILAMDNSNLNNLRAMAPPDHKASISLFLDHASNTSSLEVPDPYNSGAQGFEMVLDLIEDASNGLWQMLIKQYPYLSPQA